MKIKKIQTDLYNLSLDPNKKFKDLENYFIADLDYINENIDDIIYICLNYNLYFEEIYEKFIELLNEENKYQLFKYCINKNKFKESKVIIANKIDLDKYFVNILSVLEDKVNDIEEGLIELILIKMNKELDKEQLNFISEELKNKIHYIKNIKEF